MNGKSSSNRITQNARLDALVREGVSLHQAGKLEEAEAVYRKVILVDPGHADANHLLGVIAYQAGMPEESLELITRAIGIDLEKALYHCNLGNTLKALDRTDEAIASHRKALSLSPNLSQSHNSLGDLLLEQDRFEDAVFCFDEAIAANLGYAEAHANRGVALRNLGAYEDAAESFQKALDIRPNYALAQHNLGRTLRKLGKLDEAINCYQWALVIKPDYVEAHCNLGTAFKEKGRMDEALASYRRALAIDPGLQEISHLISSISGETTDGAPEEYIRELFDEYADRFDEHLTDALDYDIPALMRRAVDAVADGPEIFPRALDLGCGTGMVAEHFHDRAGEIDGVDLSPKMLKLAETRGVYDNLHLADVLEFLEGPNVRPEGYDLILSADTFIYIGKLDGIFAAVRRALTDGGLFVFSVEHLENGDGDFKLLPSSRYSQSDAYIEKLAAKSGLEAVSRDPVVVRKEKDTSIPGRIFVLRATA
jgi:predicted TPR repeat methyltransferase